MDFDNIILDGGLKRVGKLRKVQRRVEVYCITVYSDLDSLSGLFNASTAMEILDMLS